ncbi:MAG: PilW family protein [Steroidobacteraceae bacterium]
MSRARLRGFSLVEMVVALTIAGIVVGFAASLLVIPVQAYMTQSRRAELSGSAEAAARWISQDVHGALPNSVRAANVGPSNVVLEMIDVQAVRIYRHAGGEGDILDFTIADTQFDVLGAPGVASTYAVVNNQGVAGRDAYALSDVIAQLNIVDPLSQTVPLAAAFQFVGGPSANRRAFFVSDVTRYDCDLNSGTLRRYMNLPLTQNIAAVGAPFTVIARDVTACRFVPTPGTAQHGGLLLLEITISRVTDGATDSLRVLKQLKVEHAS